MCFKYLETIIYLLIKEQQYMNIDSLLNFQAFEETFTGFLQEVYITYLSARCWVRWVRFNCDPDLNPSLVL